MISSRRAEAPARSSSSAPPKEARARAYDLVAREKGGGLSVEEATELDDYMRMEHLMRLTKAHARAKKQHKT